MTDADYDFAGLYLAVILIALLVAALVWGGAWWFIFGLWAAVGVPMSALYLLTR